MKTYKTGDKVRVLPGWKHAMDGSPGYSTMEKLAGQILTITEEFKVYSHGITYFKVEENSWKWTMEMVEPFAASVNKKTKPELPKL